MKSFAITRFQAGLVQSAFYMGYFLLAMPAAFLMRRVGYKSGFVIGLALFGAGAFLFWPAALAGSYGFFLLALFVIRQRLVVPGDRIESLHRPVGRSGQARSAV